MSTDKVQQPTTDKRTCAYPGDHEHDHEMCIDVLEEEAAERRNPTQRTKTQHPADGSNRWTVSGEYGRVVYDVLGNHLALLPADGDVDSMGREYANRVREYAQLGDDDAVFAVLADLYRTELAGGAR